MSPTTTVIDQARALQEEIVALRRQIHAHPELSFAEVETARLAENKLKELGFAVKTGVGKTGVIGDAGTGGKLVAIRADMDGLPILETNAVPYKSKNAGVMHACGHDAHVSCALTAARLLMQSKLPGRLRMIMQPAEENGDEEDKSGAARMIEDGAMNGVDWVIGLHVDASIPAGKVAVMDGPVMAAADMFKLVIRGKGGHGAYPEATVDSVVIAAQVIQALQQVVSRRVAATEPAVVTVGSVRSSSTRGNVISETTELLGTLRTFTPETRTRVMQEIERCCELIKVMGGSYELSYEIGYPTTVNDAAPTSIMREVARELIGSANVITVPPKTWAEDFSMLAQLAPGAFMFLGVEIEGDRRSHHSPNFDIDESGLYIGSAILAETARRLMQKP